MLFSLEDPQSQRGRHPQWSQDREPTVKMITSKGGTGVSDQANTSVLELWLQRLLSVIYRALELV